MALLSKENVLLVMKNHRKDRKVKEKRHKHGGKSAVEEKLKATKLHTIIGHLKGHPLLVFLLSVFSCFIGGHSALRSKRSIKLDVEKVDENSEVWDGGTDGWKDGWAGETVSDGTIANEVNEMILFSREEIEEVMKDGYEVPTTTNLRSKITGSESEELIGDHLEDAAWGGSGNGWKDGLEAVFEDPDGSGVSERIVEGAGEMMLAIKRTEEGNRFVHGVSRKSAVKKLVGEKLSQKLEDDGYWAGGSGGGEVFMGDSGGTGRILDDVGDERIMTGNEGEMEEDSPTVSPKLLNPSIVDDERMGDNAIMENDRQGGVNGKRRIVKRVSRKDLIGKNNGIVEEEDVMIHSLEEQVCKLDFLYLLPFLFLQKELSLSQFAVTSISLQAFAGYQDVTAGRQLNFDPDKDNTMEAPKDSISTTGIFRPIRMNYFHLTTKSSPSITKKKEKNHSMKLKDGAKASSVRERPRECRLVPEITKEKVWAAVAVTEASIIPNDYYGHRLGHCLVATQDATFDDTHVGKGDTKGGWFGPVTCSLAIILVILVTGANGGAFDGGKKKRRGKFRMSSGVKNSTQHLPSRALKILVRTPVLFFVLVLLTVAAGVSDPFHGSITPAAKEEIASSIRTSSWDVFKTFLPTWVTKIDSKDGDASHMLINGDEDRFLREGKEVRQYLHE